MLQAYNPSPLLDSWLDRRRYVSPFRLQTDWEDAERTRTEDHQRAADSRQVRRRVRSEHPKTVRGRRERGEGCE